MLIHWKWILGEIIDCDEQKYQGLKKWRCQGEAGVKGAIIMMMKYQSAWHGT